MFQPRTERRDEFARTFSSCPNITLASSIVKHRYCCSVTGQPGLSCVCVCVVVSQGCFLWTKHLTRLDHFDSILEDCPCLLIYSSSLLAVRHLSSPRSESDMSTWSIHKTWQQLLDAGVTMCLPEQTAGNKDDRYSQLIIYKSWES